MFLANLAGIPLTGLWIMPAGLGVLLTQFLPAPNWLAGLALLVMQRGIQSLVFVAGFFADLPSCAPSRAATRRAGGDYGSFNGCDRILFCVSICTVAEPLCRGGTRIGRRVPHA